MSTRPPQPPPLPADVVPFAEVVPQAQVASPAPSTSGPSGPEPERSLYVASLIFGTLPVLFVSVCFGWYLVTHEVGALRPAYLLGIPVLLCLLGAFVAGICYAIAAARAGHPGRSARRAVVALVVPVVGMLFLLPLAVAGLAALGSERTLATGPRNVQPPIPKGPSYNHASVDLIFGNPSKVRYDAVTAIHPTGRRVPLGAIGPNQRRNIRLALEGTGDVRAEIRVAKGTFQRTILHAVNNGKLPSPVYYPSPELPEEFGFQRKPIRSLRIIQTDPARRTRTRATLGDRWLTWEVDSIVRDPYRRPDAPPRFIYSTRTSRRGEITPEQEADLHDLLPTTRPTWERFGPVTWVENDDVEPSTRPAATMLQIGDHRLFGPPEAMPAELAKLLRGLESAAQTVRQFK